MKKQPPSNEAADPFFSLTELKKFNQVLKRRHLSSPDQASDEFIEEIEHFLKRGRATGAILFDQDDRWACQSVLDYWLTTLYEQGLDPDSELDEFDPQTRPDLSDVACPYMGLEEFREDDHELFYGRKRLVEDFLNALKENHALLVTGRSGCGKSSLVMAGLLPALRRSNKISGSKNWEFLAPIVPGESPTKNLQAVLEPAHGEDPGGDIVRLLIVDQFEELFTLCSDIGEQKRFCETLKRLADRGDRVVLTMRSDNLQDDLDAFLEQNPHLHSTFGEDSRVTVTPLGREDLRKAIEEPARRVGLQFEKNVVKRIIDDLVGEPAGLPLLQFALIKLWEKKNRNTVEFSALKAIGGALNALQQSADELYDALPQEEQTSAKRIFLQLVKPRLAQGDEGEDSERKRWTEFTRKRVLVKDLLSSGEARDRVEQVLNRLIDGRLIRRTESVSGSLEQVEVSHEALIRNWEKLAGWLQEASHTLRFHLKLGADAEEWRDRRKDSARLYSGKKLVEAERMVKEFDNKLTPIESDFLEASRARESFKKKLKIGAVAALAVLTVIASIGWLFAVQGENEAQKARDKAEEATDRADATAKQNEKLAVRLKGRGWLSSAQARAFQSPPDRFGSAILAIRAINFDGYASKEQLEQLSKEASREFRVGNPFVGDGDDSELQTAQDLIQASDVYPIWRSPLARHQVHGVTALAVSPDENLLVSAGKAGAIYLWNPATGARLHVFSGHESEVTCVAFNSNGSLLVSGDRDGNLMMWDPIKMTLLDSLPLHMKPITCVAFRPHDPPIEGEGTEIVASGSEDGNIKLSKWNGSDLVQDKIMDASKGPLHSLAFTRDGRKLATGGSHGLDPDFKEGILRFWDIERFLEEADYKAPWHEFSSPITSVAVEIYDSNVLLTAGDSSGKIDLFMDPQENGELNVDRSIPTPFTDGEKNRIERLTFRKKGDLLASSDAAGGIQILKTSEMLLPESERDSDFRKEIPRAHRGIVSAITFLSDKGSHLMSGGADGTLKKWDVESGKAVGASDDVDSLIAGLQPESAALATHPDGEVLASSGMDGRIRLSKSSTGEEIPFDGPYPDATGGVNVTSLTYGNDLEGEFLASGNSKGEIQIWRSKEGKPEPELPKILTAHAGSVTHLIHHRKADSAGSDLGGDLLFISLGLDGKVRFWDLKNGEKPIKTIAEPSTEGSSTEGSPTAPEIKCITLDPSGKILAAGCKDGSILFIDIDDLDSDYKKLPHLSAHDSAVTSVAFSHDSMLFASANEAGWISVWEGKKLEGEPQPLTETDPETYQQVSQFRAHQDSVRDLSFSTDDRYLAAASDDRTVKIWELSKEVVGRELQANVTPYTTLTGHATPVTHVVFLPPGQGLVTIGEDGSLHGWNIEPELLVKSVQLEASPATGVAIDEKGILTIGSSSELPRRNLADGKDLDAFRRQSKITVNVATRADGTLIATTNTAGDIFLWDGDSEDRKPSKEALKGPFSCLTFSPDGKILAAGMKNGDIQFFDVANTPLSPKKINDETPTPHTERVTDLVFIGNILISSSEDGTIHVWDRKEKKIQAQCKTPRELPVFNISLSPDLQSIVSAGADGFIRVWSMTGTEEREWFAHNGGVLSLRTDPKSEQLVTGGRDKTVKLWNFEDGSLLRAVSGEHKNQVNSVAFSHDGRYFVSSSIEGKVNIFDREKFGFRPEYTSFVLGHWLTMDPTRHEFRWNLVTDNLFKPKIIPHTEPAQ